MKKIDCSTFPAKVDSTLIGSWAYNTMHYRIIESILPNIFKDNEEKLKDWKIRLKLEELKKSIMSYEKGKLIDVSEEGPDFLIWNQILAEIPKNQRDWIRSPWLISEFYFYRRVIDCFDYFETKYDMFKVQKSNGLLSSELYIEKICEGVKQSLQVSTIETNINLALRVSLWGNKMDLSLWSSIEERLDNDLKDIFNYKDSNILDNQSSQLIQWILAQGNKKSISIIIDNAGYELFTDIVLAYIFLKLELVDEIVFHTKGHPTFVSDATDQDFIDTVEFLSNSKHQIVLEFGRNVKELISRGSIVCKEDLYWCQPLPFWEMPDSVYSKLAESYLVIVKGDANYRRILGDRNWAWNTPSSKVFDYWTLPVCALRTLKSEIGCGINNSCINYAESCDKNWKVSGNWGVIQFKS